MEKHKLLPSVRTVTEKVPVSGRMPCTITDKDLDSHGTYGVRFRHNRE
jgi:hypothetical protein